MGLLEHWTTLPVKAWLKGNLCRREGPITGERMRTLVLAVASAAVLWLWCQRRCRSRAVRRSGVSASTIELAPGVRVEVEQPARPRTDRPRHVIIVGAGTCQMRRPLPVYHLLSCNMRLTMTFQVSSARHLRQS